MGATVPGAVDAETWRAQGLRLAEARRENMTRWIAEDPERALAEVLTPRQYARLPEEIRAQVERPVVAEGFYGVLGSVLQLQVIVGIMGSALRIVGDPV